MAYKALYRKYRPDTFDSVIGQGPIIKTLQNTIKENKIGHAYLFCGPRGTGKTSVAKLFAKSVNCLNPQNGLTCNNCEVCKYLNGDNVTDIIEIDAASNNSVDEIRELKNKVNLVPSKCKYKVYIIDEVHMLSIGAFNALLKTLEEPPAHVIFILATTEAHKIPLTIVSRCQNFDFKKITDEKIKERLKYIIEKEKIKIEDEAIDEIARIADGGLRDAIGMLEQINAYADEKITLSNVHQISGTVSTAEIIELLKSVLENKLENALDWINAFYQEGKDFIKISDKLIVNLRNVLLYKKASKIFKDKFSENADLYKELSNLIDEDDVYNYINEINRSLNDMRFSTYPKILFEILILRLIKPKSFQPEPIKSVNVEIKEKEPTEPIKEEVKKTTEEEYIKKAESKKALKEKTEKSGTMPDEYKNILVNNTIAFAEKKYIKELEEKWKQLQTYLINKDYKASATILLDAKIVSASNDHVILIYKYDAMVEKFDEKVNELETLLIKIMERNYVAVALTEDDWQQLRPYYLELKKSNKEIKVLPEDNIEEYKKKESLKKVSVSEEIKEAIDIFGKDLIEMRG